MQVAMDLDNNPATHIDALHQNNGVSSRNGHIVGMGHVEAASSLREDIPPVSAVSAFNLTDRLQIFSYLVNSNRIRWYRVIMRVFLQRHRELYRYQLTAQEVRDAVRDSFDPEYTLEQCQNDLAALKEWGKIITFYDASRATST